MKTKTAYRMTRLIMMLSVFLLTSCHKHHSTAGTDLNDPTTELIKVTGEYVPSSLKSTLTDQSSLWIAQADKVGIYSPEARTQTGGTGTPVVNARFTAGASESVSDFTGTMYWGAADALHHFYAYYPYSAGTPAVNTVPVSLPPAQSQSTANNSDHIGILDFLIATPLSLTSPVSADEAANAVDLQFNHLFTILEFHIKGSGTIKAVKLMASNTLAFSGGTIDITQATPASGEAYSYKTRTGTTDEVVVILTNPATLTSVSSETKVYMVINPGIQTGDCTIGLSADGTTWKYITKPVIFGGFQRSAKYTVEINSDDAV